MHRQPARWVMGRWFNGWMGRGCLGRVSPQGVSSRTLQRHHLVSGGPGLRAVLEKSRVSLKMENVGFRG